MKGFKFFLSFDDEIVKYTLFAIPKGPQNEKSIFNRNVVVGNRFLIVFEIVQLYNEIHRMSDFG